jgi:hypothetical protein
MAFPRIQNVEFEPEEERLKVALPAERHVIFLGLYSVLLLAWLGVTVWMISLLFETSISDLPTMFLIVWVLILLVWAYVWYRLGRSVWYWWQYYAATREILFIDKELLIVRRPLSLFGVTDAYDMEHVGPFYYSEKNDAVTFEYGSRAGQFGKSLMPEEGAQLAKALNRRFFPEALVPDEDEESIYSVK